MIEKHLFSSVANLALERCLKIEEVLPGLTSMISSRLIYLLLDDDDDDDDEDEDDGDGADV